jgi:hypothetical protein
VHIGNSLTNYSENELAQFIALVTAVCCNPFNSSTWYYGITGQLYYKHTFCQNVVSIKILFVRIF